MKKLRNIGLFPIIVSLAAIVFGQGSAEYNKVDGFTSATYKLRVDSILVFRDHADVYWWEFYPDTADILKYQIEWGTTDSVTYTDTLRLQPYKNKIQNIAKIMNLKDSTAYFAQFHRDWHGTVKKNKFILNTPPMANSIRQARIPRFMPSSKNVTGVELYTLNGKRVFLGDIKKGVDVGSLRPSAAAPGLYIVNYTGAAKNIVGTEMRVFGR